MNHLHSTAIDLFGVQFLPSRWIDRIRRNPDLVQRVLADVGSMQKERRIRTTAAAAAENLFQMWAEVDELNKVEKSL